MADVLTSIADINALDRRYPSESHGALIEGSVDGRARKGVAIKGRSGRIRIKNRRCPAPKPGSLVRVAGYVQIDPFGDVSVVATNIVHLADGNPPPIVPVTPSDLETGNYHLVAVKVEGTVTKAFYDEIDKGWSRLHLKDNHGQVIVSISDPAISQEQLDELIDADVSVTGICEHNNHGHRRFIGKHLNVDSKDDIRIVKPAPADPFSLPRINIVTDLARLPQRKFIHRQCISGHIVATWGGNRLMLRAHDGYHMQVSLSKPFPGLTSGTPVTVAGFLQKDAFYVRLTEALLRIDTNGVFQAEKPYPCTARRILLGDERRFGIDPNFHGRTIRMKGTVRHVSNRTRGESQISLDNDGDIVSVIVGSAVPPAINSVVEVTGACIMEMEPEEDGIKFGRLKGFSVILRSPEDLKIISSPSWWTPQRLLAVIMSLLAMLLAIIVWNRVLQRIVERRSRALIKSQIDKIGAELRIDERTRLAVELHDSLAQNLTGVSLQIAAAQTAQHIDTAAADRHLTTADRMLKSCRTELRRCIWDLREDTLEERDFAEAVRKTLQPVVGTTPISVRMAVPRARLSDSTAHAVLRIIRELVSNAIHHGKARHIYVAGNLENGHMRVSVRDDGQGFSPENCPGPNLGHFGLDGIRERVKRLGGTFTIESAPSKGTYARIEIGLARSHGEKGCET